MYLCYVTGTLKNVVSDEKIQWNPDTQGITFTTDSTAGSNEQVYVYFSDNAGHYAGGVLIYFNTTIQYYIDWCSNTYNNFPVSLPAAPDKTWTITYNTAEQRVVYYCNGVQALNVLLSDIECTDSRWRTEWERNTTQIQFLSSDTASDSYCFSSNTGKYNEGFQEA